MSVSSCVYVEDVYKCYPFSHVNLWLFTVIAKQLQKGNLTSTTDIALQNRQCALEHIKKRLLALFSTLIKIETTCTSEFTWRFSTEVFIFSRFISSWDVTVGRPQSQTDTLKWKIVRQICSKTTGCLTPCLFVVTALSIYPFCHLPRVKNHHFNQMLWN